MRDTSQVVLYCYLCIEMSDFYENSPRSQDWATTVVTGVVITLHPILGTGIYRPIHILLSRALLFFKTFEINCKQR